VVLKYQLELEIGVLLEIIFNSIVTTSKHEPWLSIQYQVNFSVQQYQFSNNFTFNSNNLANFSHSLEFSPLAAKHIQLKSILSKINVLEFKSQGKVSHWIRMRKLNNI